MTATKPKGCFYARLLISGLALCAVVSGCGSGHRKAGAPPRWVQRANAVCKRDDARAGSGAFDSAAMITGLRSETTDLVRAGFFTRVPEAALDLELAGRLLSRDRNGDFGLLRRADRALLRARRAAARRNVHCSFAAVPLQNL